VTAQRDRRLTPLALREAVALQVLRLLREETPAGKKRWTQSSLGAAIGLSQETVRRAMTPNGVTPAVVEGISALVGLTPEQIMEKYADGIRDLAREEQAAVGLPVDPRPPIPPENEDLRRKTVLRLQLRPYNLTERSAEEIVARQLYARKHVVPLDEDRFAQLCYLTEQEILGEPVGSIEDEVSLPAPPAARRVPVAAIAAKRKGKKGA